MHESGLAQFLLTLRPALQRFLMARGASVEDAEDILQDLYLKAGQATAPVAEPKAYLYRMADNLFLDRRRSAARRMSREDSWVSTQVGEVVDRDDRPSPEQVLIDRERMSKVIETIGTLPERTAAALRLYRLEGHSQQQIAAEMGISLSAVEKHLQRAYRALRDCRVRLDAEIGEPRRQGDEGGEQVADGG